MLGDDSTFENRGVRGVEEQTFLEHQLARCARLGASFVGQRHIVPAGEQVRLVPCAFAMSQDDEGAGHEDDDI